MKAWLLLILRGHPCSYGCGARYRHPAAILAHYLIDHAGD